jgi:hypothetical protein
MRVANAEQCFNETDFACYRYSPILRREVKFLTGLDDMEK